jgi:biotin carboxyl carrier protein
VTIEVASAGRTHRFDVSRLGAGWRVQGSERAHRVSLVPAGSRWSLLVGAAGPEAGARSYEVVFDGRRVSVNGRAFSTQVVRSVPGRNASGPAGASAIRPLRTVSSPMPGRVVRVLVGPGDVVADRQSLVVVEAMKMENEVRAPRAGVVAEVLVVEGMPVEARTVLVVLE